MFEWILCSTRTELPTVKVIGPQKSFYLHSSYDPWKEAVRWVDNLLLDVKDAGSFIVLAGMGAGYHVRALSRMFPAVPIHVWDFNTSYARWIQKTGLLSWMKQDAGNITYRFTESLEVIRTTFLPLIQGQGAAFLIHPPSLEIIPAHLNGLKQILEDHLLFVRTVNAQGHLLDKNYRTNLLLGDPGINHWVNKYINRPAILVSTGPSLNKQLKQLKSARRKGSAIIGSVGTALTPLQKAGITPDFIMLSDPQEVIIEQIREAVSLDIPLFYLCTANAKAIAYYQGPRYIVWQKGFCEAETQAEARKEPLINTGGSVATCLLDLMVRMGCGPIALVGQDLAFTGGQSHAAGAHNARSIDTETALLQVTDFYRSGRVSTSRNLYSYLRWFEQYVRDRQEEAGRFWNCTEGGAYLDGWKHSSLTEFLQNFASV